MEGSANNTPCHNVLRCVIEATGTLLCMTTRSTPAVSAKQYRRGTPTRPTTAAAL